MGDIYREAKIYPFRGGYATMRQIARETGYSLSHTKSLVLRKGKTPDELDAMHKGYGQKRLSQNPYSEEDLYEIYRRFERGLSKFQKLRILADFMEKEDVDQEVIELMNEFRMRGERA